jgi:hypothetical protein
MANELTPKQQLQAVFALLSNRSLWTQGSLARDVDGNDLDNPLDDQATCWCVEGAFRKMCGINERDSFIANNMWDAWQAMCAATSYGPVCTNDDSGYEAVLAMITKAMELV